MKDGNQSLGRAPVTECVRKRLAENAIVAVDVCDCGVMQLHVGAVTLRMSPCAVSELVATLARALEANHGTSEAPALVSHGRSRGQA